MQPIPHIPIVPSCSLGRYDDAAGAIQRAIARNPDIIFARHLLAATYARLDRMDEAAEVLRLNPGFSVRRLAERLPYEDQAVLEHLVDGLRTAGLPE